MPATSVPSAAHAPSAARPSVHIDVSGAPEPATPSIAEAAEQRLHEMVREMGFAAAPGSACLIHASEARFAAPPPSLAAAGQTVVLSPGILGVKRAGAALSDGASSGAWSALASRAATIPLAAGSVDRIWSGDALARAPMPSQYVAELHRVLRPGGSLLLTTPNAGAYLAALRGARRSKDPLAPGLCDLTQLRAILDPWFELREARGLNRSLLPEADAALREPRLVRAWLSLYEDRPELASDLIVHARRRDDVAAAARQIVRIGAPSQLFRLRGGWTSVWLDGLKFGQCNAGKPQDVAELSFEAVAATIHFWSHPWSGVAEIDLDGERLATIDLYGSTGCLVRVDTPALPFGWHMLRVRPTGRRDPRAAGAQIIIHEAWAARPASMDATTRPHVAARPGGFAIDAARRVQVDGVELDVFDDEDDVHVSRVLAGGQWHEPGVARLIRESLRPGDTAVDVGAHIGAYTLLMSQQVGPRGRVFAFEPDPVNFQMLRRNVDKAGATNVTLVHAAVSDQPGKGRLFLGESNQGDHRLYDDGTSRASLPVDIVDLDGYFAGLDVHFVKCDVQGSEWAVLRGMRGLLQRQSALTMLWEYWPGGLRRAGVHPVHLTDALLEAGFSLWEVSDDGSALRQASGQRLRSLGASEPEAFVNLLCRKVLPAPSGAHGASMNIRPSRFGVIYTAPILMTWSERVVLYGAVFGRRPQRCLEIGTNKGGAAMVMCAALDDLGAGKLICVDPAPVIWPEHWQQIQHRTTLLTGKSPDLLPDAAKAAGGRFDFALIDGDHTKAGVIRDIEGVLEFADDDAYLLFHDAHFTEVREAIDEVLARQKDALADCGLISSERTPDPKQPNVFWGGLRLLRYRRRSR